MQHFTLAFENIQRRRSAYAFAVSWIFISVFFTISISSLAESSRMATLRQIDSIPTIKQIEVYRQTNNQILDKNLETQFKSLPGVKSVVLIDNLSGDLLFQGYEQSISIIGVDGISTLDAFGYLPAEGSAELGKRMVIVGSEVPGNFYLKTKQVSTQNLLGNPIKIRMTKYTGESSSKKKYQFSVAGVLRPTGSFQVDNAIFLTSQDAESMKKWLLGSRFNRKTDGYDSLILLAATVDDVGLLDTQVQDLGYYPSSRILEVQKLQQVTENLRGFSWVLALTSILSSIVGIFLTMVSIIGARKTEIGLMKAVGASQSLVMKIFLLETVLIGALGGVIGVVITLAVFGAYNAFFASSLKAGEIIFSGVDFKSIELYVPFWLGILSPVAAILTSILAGYIPARRAAEIDPIEAMRSSE